MLEAITRINATRGKDSLLRQQNQIRQLIFLFLIEN
jgi:hypothetical protein